MINKTSRHLNSLAIWLITIALMAQGFDWAVADTQPADEYQAAKKRVASGRARDIPRLRQAFLETTNLQERLQLSETLTRRLRSRLNQEANHSGPQQGNVKPAKSPQKAKLTDEELSIANQLLEANYNDSFAHQRLAEHYKTQGLRKQAKLHQRINQAILKILHNSEAQGSQADPVPILTPAEAYAYADMVGFEVLGGLYNSASKERLTLVLVGRSPDNPVHRQLYFSLNAIYQALRQRKATTDAENNSDFSPGDLISFLALSGDMSAKVSIGNGLAADPKRLEDAISWLRAADRNGNIMGTLLLARMYRDAKRHPDAGSQRFALDQAQSLYLKAIAQGSDTAMLQLGLLYLSGAFGSDGRFYGITLLEQARHLNNVNAMLVLAQIYNSPFRILTPSKVSKPIKSPETSAKLWHEAGELGNLTGQVAYATFQIDHHAGQGFDLQAYEWLKTIVDNAQNGVGSAPESLPARAMMLLGWANARGLVVAQNFDAARSWWEQAARSSNNSNFIDEISYTLVAINEPALRNSVLALHLMDELMNRDAKARNNYVYLKTWASAYADNNQFERAISLQSDAIAKATQLGNKVSNGKLKILKVQLEALRKGEIIRDVRLYKHGFSKP